MEPIWTIATCIIAFLGCLLGLSLRSEPKQLPSKIIRVPRSKNIPQLTLVIGPMFAGKTGEVIRRLQRFYRQRQRCLVIKNYQDNRFNTKDQELKLVTHDGSVFKIHTEHDYLDLVYNQNIDDLRCRIPDYDVVVIEEAHMWRDKWWSFVEYCLYECRKQVIISTIDSYSPTNGQLKPISDLATAVVHSTEIIKLTSVCVDCYQDTGVVSCYKGTQQQLIEVGGSEKYEPKCWLCSQN